MAAARVTPTPTSEGEQDAVGRDCRTLEADRSDAAHDRHDGSGEGDADSDADEGPDDAQNERLAEHEAHDLAAAGTRGAQQADLADPFRDGHRQRVEDQECASEEGDRGDQRGRHREVRGRAAQGRGDVGRRREDVRLGGQTALEGGLRRRGGGAAGQADVDPRDGRRAEDGLRRSKRDHHGPPVRVGARPVTGDDPDDPVRDVVAETADREGRSDREAVLGSQPAADEGRPAGRVRQWVARGEDDVVDARVERRIDAEDRHGRRQSGRWVRLDRRRQVGAAFERRSSDGDTGRARDGRHGRVGQAGLAEGRDAQVGPADHVADRAADRCVDTRVGGHAGEKDCDAEGDTERAEAGTQRMGAQAAEGEPIQGHRTAAYRPSLARRAMSGAASCNSRRPSSIVSRMRPVADDVDAVGIGRRLRIVGHEDDRLAAPDARAPQRVEDLGAGRVVEVAGRLVREQERRSGDEGAGDGHSLLLAGRQLVGLVMLLAGQVDQRDDVADRGRAARPGSGPRRRW